MKSLAAIVGESAIRANCPKHLSDRALEMWFSLQEPSPFPTPHELARLAAEVSGRLHQASEFDGGAPVIEEPETTPKYVSERFEDGDRETFELHLAEAGCAKADGLSHLGVLSECDGWSAEAADILVEGAVLGRDDPFHGLIEVDGANSVVREFLARSSCADEILARCCQYPGALMECIEFGIEAFWIGECQGDAADLSFEVGPAFEKSIEGMNYARDDRYAASCLRSMALIAGGRARDIRHGHIERDGAGGNNPHLRDENGDLVKRVHLASNSPDANRLFWVDAERPRFLNVSGHEGRPAL